MYASNDCLPSGQQQVQPVPDPAATNSAALTLRAVRHIFAAAAKAGFVDLAKALLQEYDVEQLADLDPSLYDQFVDHMERRCGLCLRD